MTVKYKKAVGAALAAGAMVALMLLSRVLTSEARRIEGILAAYQEQGTFGYIALEYPFDGTLFPPEIVPPTFRWKDGAPASRRWLVRIAFADGGPDVRLLLRRPRWTPGPQEWEKFKQRSLEKDARVLILGVGRGRTPEILSRTNLSFRTSQDPVGAPLFYREVVLPFLQADKDPSRMRWRFGSIGSSPPPAVLEHMTVCANCHSFDQAGTTLAMDADFANDKGSYIITPIKPQMVLTPGDIMTWNDFTHSGPTSGLLSQIAPDGRHVISTVQDMAVFVPRPPLAFSQLFFPVKGILCVYDRQTREFRSLPGANDPNFVQSNPNWSPDGREIVFARSRIADFSRTRGQGLRPLTRDECEVLLEDGKPFRFDLYEIPFNEGRGGTPQPLAGASHNDMSNYFPRYSPDGRWIVFCRANSYMLLQPDSELFIIPAGGGTARRLRCNTRRMNSWHSWSPNGKWLVFSSKAWSDYTQLCLTHIDENGDSSPPVLLAHLTAPDRAANIPEFVNTSPTAIVQIREQFVKKRH
jgi:hypothetical protein